MLLKDFCRKIDTNYLIFISSDLFSHGETEVDNSVDKIADASDISLEEVRVHD